MERWLVAVGGGICLLGAMTACRSTYNVRRIDDRELARESTIVFVRPTKYHPFLGTYSLTDYIKVTHEQAQRNAAGLFEVSVGLRDVGGAHWWDLAGKDFPLSIKTAFYAEPYLAAGGGTAPPVYETNWETVRMLRGATSQYKVICPVKSAGYYQVTISELVR